MPTSSRSASRAFRSLTEGGVLFIVVFAAVHALLAATTDGLSAPEVVELVLICVPEALLLVRRRTGGPALAAVSAALLVAAALGCAGLPFGRSAPDYTAWQFGAISIVLIAVMLQGRYATACAVMLGVSALAVGWSFATGHGPWPGVLLIVRHVATLFVAGCFIVGWRRTLRSARAFRALADRQQAVESAAQARTGARRTAVETVLERAGPMLAALAEGRPLTPADRRELLVIEGDLRDRMRAGRLLTGRLPASVAAARRRGMDVLLLDESEHGAAGSHAAAADWLADRLDATAAGRFVGRLRDEPVRLVAAAGSESTSDTAAF